MPGMPAFIDLTGQRFGKLTVIARAPIARRGYWTCKCDCGETSTAEGTNLRLGKSTSCGCNKAIATAAKNTTHGQRHTRAYRIWAGMKARCVNPNRISYPNYGGRGVKLCARWEEFENFLADMGHPPPKHSIDRIDNEGDYEPGNCRWATKIQQMNNRRDNPLLSHAGFTRTIAEWSRVTGIPRYLIYDRIFNRGWSVANAVTKPPRKIRRHH